MGGGTETSTLDLIKNFDSSVDVTVCYFYNNHELHSLYKESNCKVVFFDLPGSYSFVKGIKALYRLVKREKYDVIVTSLYRASIMSRIVSLVTGVPLVDTMVNDSYGEAKRREFKGVHAIKFLLVFLLDKATAGIPKRWISNSKFLKENLSRKLGIDQQKVQVIYRGRESRFIEKWMLPSMQSDFHFITIGRLYLQKAQDQLIGAFAAFNKMYPNSKLTIYGEGPERQKLEHLIRAYNLENKVFLPGRVNNAWKKLYEAHCFVLPSHYEGFSGALVEALLAGIPIIASSIPMNKEAIIHEQNGIIHEVNNQADLLKKMKMIYAYYDNAVKMGTLARKDALAKYDSNTIAAQYLLQLKLVALNKRPE